MRQRFARSICGKDALVRAFALAALTAVILLPRASHAEPDPRNVLLVANGYYAQENDIENHLLDLGYSVTRLKDYKLKGTTSLAPYDLIVISEFAPGIPTSGIDNLKTAGKPILIVEYWDFSYSYKLGLTTSSSCGYVGTDTITSIREGYDDFTSRVGAEALVYQPQYTVHGIDIANVKPNATPVYWSSESFEEVAVLVDTAKKIAVTGVYDTRKYTVDAWKMFDILLGQILPAPATYATMDEVAQAYVDSGLYTLAADIEADLKQDPQSWTFDEAELYAWQLVTEWGLGELWDYMQVQLADVFDTPLDLPDIGAVYVHPERPHGTDPGYLPDVPPVEHEHWFMGQYWNPNDNNLIYDPLIWGQHYDGTDLGLGINATLHGRRYFYMGDTWDQNAADGIPNNEIQMWSAAGCGLSDTNGLITIPARCDDMIAVSTDNSPEDGIDASPVFDGSGKWEPLVIPGVHNDFSPQLEIPGTGFEYWSGPDDEPPYTVPTGAVQTTIPGRALVSGEYIPVYLPGIVLWYGTAIHPSAQNPNLAFSDLDPKRRPASWVGCSADGISFRACYRNDADEVVPFSVDVAPWTPALPGVPQDTDGGESMFPGSPARFIQVAPIPLSEDDFDAVCGAQPTNALCSLFPSGATSRSGLLLYGSGRPYRKSGLFLAFIRTNEIGEVDNTSGKPKASYWTGAGWSPDESAAATLTDNPCDDWRQPNFDEQEDPTIRDQGCWPIDINPATPDWYQRQVFGELSARLIQSTLVEPRIVLLNNPLVWYQDSGTTWWVLSWKAPLSEPWGGDFPSTISPIAAETSTYGYGPYIIDGMGDTMFPGESGDTENITLWHTISVWDGTPNTPYGVYTGSEVIPW